MGLVCNDVTYLGASRRGAPAPTLRRGYCAGKTDSPLYAHATELATGGNAAFFSGFCKAYQMMSLIGFSPADSYHADAALFAPLLAPLRSDD